MQHTQNDLDRFFNQSIARENNAEKGQYCDLFSFYFRTKYTADEMVKYYTPYQLRGVLWPEDAKDLGISAYVFQLKGEEK